MLVSENTHVYMLGQGTDFYRYDTGTQVWTQLTNLPLNVGCSRLGNCNGVGTTNAYLYGSVACNGRILLYSHSTLRIYNIATQTWTTGSLPNTANGDGMAGTLKERRTSAQEGDIYGSEFALRVFRFTPSTSTSAQ